MASKGHDVYVLTYNRLRVDGKFFSLQKDVVNNAEVMRDESDFI
jgi:hypothetical protein